MINAHDLKREVSHYSLLLHERGWVANHDGNVSARLDKEGRFAITPTATSKRKCSPESIVSCDASGAPQGSGPRKGKPPGEVALHVAAYRARADVHAVIHAHPVQASAFAMAQRALAPIAMPEVIVSLGDKIPLVPTVMPKDARTAGLIAEALGIADVMLLGGNGVLAVGVDLEQAYLRLELVEHYARILAASVPLGGPAALDPALVARLLEQRRAAGLGPQPITLPATPPLKTPVVASGDKSKDKAPAAGDGIRAIVEDEIRRALGGKR